MRKNFEETASFDASLSMKFYHSVVFRLMARLKKIRPLFLIPNDPWPGNIHHGSKVLESFGRFLHPKITGDFWKQDVVQKDPYFTTFEWMRDMRAVGDNKSRRFVRYMMQSWIMFQKKLPPQLLTPKLAGLRLAQALSLYEFYAQSGEDRFLSLLHKYFFREFVRLRWISLRMPASFETVCALKGALLASLAYSESKSRTAVLLNKLTKTLTHILFSDGFTHEGRVDTQFQLACHLVEIRNFLRIYQDPGAAEKIQQFIDRITPPLRLLRHGDGQLSLLSGVEVASAHHVDTVLSLSEARGRSPGRSDHAGFERMLLKNHLVLMRTKPSSFLKESTGNLYFEWSVGKDRILKSCDVILENEYNKSLLSQYGATVQKYSEKDHAYLEGSLKDAQFTHRRQLYLTEGMDFRGSDRLSTNVLGFGALRFVLSPDFFVESQNPKKAIILSNQRGERLTLTVAGQDGITTDYVQIFGKKHPVIFALFQLLPGRDVELKWSLRGG